MISTSLSSRIPKLWVRPDKGAFVIIDRGQILGIGDQGVGGILIAVAKLALYTLCAGVHPHRVLPVVLDCGTDVRLCRAKRGRRKLTGGQNESHLNDDLYLGLKRPRVRGKEYDNFVNHFINTAQKYYPKALLHFVCFLLFSHWLLYC